MRRLLFQEYEQKQNHLAGARTNSILPIGGFVPGQMMETAPHLQMLQLAEAILEATGEKMVDVQTVTKTPILFDEYDVKFLMQVPARFATTLLAYRYNGLLLYGKKLQESKQKIPARGMVPLRDRQRNIKFHQGLDGKRGINLYLQELIEKLTKPRDLDALSKMSPDDKEKYKGGLYGYNLDNAFTHEGTGEKFADAYIAMTVETARSVMNPWLNGMLSGTLRTPDMPDYRVASVGFGGGVAGKNYTMDWNGNVYQPQAGSITLPVHDSKTISALGMTANFDKEGRVIYTYEVNGEVVQEPAYMVAWQPGKLIDKGVYDRYSVNMNQINELIQKEGLDPKDPKVQQLIESSKELLKGNISYDAFAYNVHRFNRERDEEGRRKYPRLYNHNIVGQGSVQPHTNQPETIQGREKDADELTRRFGVASYDNENDIYRTLGPNGAEHARSAVASGVGMFLKKIHGTFEWYILNSDFNDLVQEGLMRLRRMAGEPSWVRALEVLKDPKTDAQTKERVYEQVFEEIKDLAADMTNSIWQLDWGRGTRRKRSQDAATGVAKFSYNDAITAAQQGRERGDYEGDSDAFQKGQHRNIARGPTRQSQVHFSHHLQNIKRRADLYSQKVKQLQQERQTSHSQGKEAPPDNFIADLRARGAMFNELVQLFIADKLQQVPPDQNWTMQDAYKWADQNMRGYLQEKGVSVSSMGDVQSLQVPKDVGRQQEADKKDIMTAAERIRKFVDKESSGAFASGFVKDPAQLEKLLTDPDALLQSFQRVKDLEGRVDDEDLDSMLDILQQIKRQAEVLNGGPIFSSVVEKKLGSILEDDPQPLSQKELKARILTPAFINNAIEHPSVLEKVKEFAKEYPAYAEALKAIEAEMKKRGVSSSSKDDEGDVEDFNVEDDENYQYILQQLMGGDDGEPNSGPYWEAKDKADKDPRLAATVAKIEEFMKQLDQEIPPKPENAIKKRLKRKKKQ